LAGARVGWETSGLKKLYHDRVDTHLPEKVTFVEIVHGS
jgi:hypothetical protein